jgi:CubicO group peptidase (beta-lactamase class C family)
MARIEIYGDKELRVLLFVPFFFEPGITVGPPFFSRSLGAGPFHKGDNGHEADPNITDPDPYLNQPQEVSMFRSIRRVSPLFLIAVVCWSCGQQPEVVSEFRTEPPATGEIIAALESRIPELMAEARIPGLGICLVADTEIAWCGAFGVTDAETGGPVGPATAFQAASLSKPVFAYTVLQLVDEGLLDLDRPMVEYVGLEKARSLHLGDSFDDPRVEKITTRMILTHTAGFPNWRRNGELVILFDPGERFGYSGEAFGLLQQAVEQITELPLEELVRVRTFEPLGMTQSTYTAANIDLDDYAWPHDGAGEPRPRPDDLESRLARARPHAAASLTTTASDYARFLIALTGGTGLENSTWSDLVRPHVDVNEDGEVAWGLGTGLERSESGFRVWHWGDNGDSKALYVAAPSTGDGMVYFANGYNGLSIARALLEIAMPGDHPLLEGALMDDYPPYDGPAFAFSSAVYSGGAADAIAVVRGLQDEGSATPVSEGTVNNMGYWLLGRERLDEAIALFELNVELYPESWNVYDSLGEAQLEKGLREEALANYRRSLELNPENRGARRVLEEAGLTVP